MKVVHDAANCEFLLLDDQEHIVGEITYKESDGCLHVLHTGVRYAYQGQGYAMRLVDALVEYAGHNGFKVVPVCPYVVNVFRKYPDKYSSVM